jgi:Ca2+:H+ antiporter
MTDPMPSSGAQGVLDAARAEAVRLGHDAVGAEHLLLGLLQNGGPAREVLAALGVEPEAARERLGAMARRGRARNAPGPASGDGLAYTSHAKRIIDLATREAQRGGGALTAEWLLAAAVEDPKGGLARLLVDAGVPAADARVRVRRQLGLPVDPLPTGARPERAPAEERPATVAAPQVGGRRRPAGGEDRRAAAAEGPKTERRAGKREGPRPPVPEPRAARSEPPAVPRHLAPRRRSLSWKAVLLLAVPVSIGLNWAHQSPVLVFFASCLAVLPLAGYMGEATEHLAQKTGPTVGGLLNATFGNAAELIIAIVALRAGLVELVKASITGSILGNLLMILGLAILAAGTKRSEIRFNRTSAGMSSAMLALAVVGLLLPALFHAVHPEAAARATELRMSEWVAGILIVTYGFSLLFSLKTHRCLFGGDAHPMEGPVWGTGKALLILAVATALVAVESEILVHATEAVTGTLRLSEVFLGLVIVPIIGNAAEHATAVVVARKGQMDLALQIALGSSTQIALLVGPMLVFVGLGLGQPMDLVFSQFEVMALALSTFVVAILTHDGESHWFEGVQLLAVYAMMAVAAFFI